jgi:hypothetical protein
MDYSMTWSARSRTVCGIVNRQVARFGALENLVNDD